MRILMINKFLYPNGGTETYILKLGRALEESGHDVQYFGMLNEKNIVGNKEGAYTIYMDFHKDNVFSKIKYGFSIIYSTYARKQIRKILNSFKPEIIHLNLFNFQITPSILIEIDKYKKKHSSEIKVIYTAHDSQMVCPNHLMLNPKQSGLCTKCIGGHYYNCAKNKCIHDSRARSIMAALEAFFWNHSKVYSNIDVIISPSLFLAEKLKTNSKLKGRILVLQNFIDSVEKVDKIDKKKYILYFGRYSEEKGIRTLLKVARELNYIKFIFAGSGPLETEIEEVPNAKNVGFLYGNSLKKLIEEAQFTIICSECSENCPFSVMESIMLGTPVLGAEIGGIPELIKVGEKGLLFESGNSTDLKEKIIKLWNNEQLLQKFNINCQESQFDTIQEYTKKLIDIYKYS